MSQGYIFHKVEWYGGDRRASWVVARMQVSSNNLFMVGRPLSFCYWWLSAKNKGTPPNKRALDWDNLSTKILLSSFH